MPDPIAGTPNGERRRSVRQKLHTPVYASFNGPQTGMVVDLSELLDLNEEGFAVQTSERLEVNRAVTLCLDLPETRSFIHGAGQVIWSDDAGRGGIRFSALPERSRKILKEWLFANLLIASVNHAARTEQRAKREEEKPPLPKLLEPLLLSKVPSIIPIPERSETLSLVETGLAPSQQRQSASLQLEEVRTEVRDIGDNVDAVFQRITERALSLTGASGAALAFLTDDKMICRAQAGEPSPPLGAPVDAKQGLSGECIRTGQLISCEDTGNDFRVDPEVCRALGIGSLMAVPIVSDFRVVGLLEVFSPHPHAFTGVHGTVLERLVEMIPKTHPDKPQSADPQLEKRQPETPIERESVPSMSSAPVETGLAPSPAAMELPTPGVSAAAASAIEASATEFDSMHAIREALWEPEHEAPELQSQPVPKEIISEQIPEQVAEPLPPAPSRVPHFALLGLTVAVVAMALGYLVGPIIEKRWANSPQRALVEGAEASSTVPAQSTNDPSALGQHAQGMPLADLLNLANHGNTEAQWQLGVRYHDGEGVPQDDAQAMLWFQLAAEQGHVDAQAHLGAYYWAGRGVPEDLSKAYMWSAIALAGGDKNSESRLEGLASQMTRAQVTAARQQAEVWIRTHTQGAKSNAN